MAMWPDARRPFRLVKAELCKPTVLAFYTPDASSHGLGAVLQQKTGGEWKPVAYASRSMSDTEKRYAQIEKGALATVWACDKFATYIVGLKFHIETDHKPLVSLLGSKHLDALPSRILRFQLRLARFDYTIQHVPGKLLCTADALSRALGPITKADQQLEEEAEYIMVVSVKHLPAGQDLLQTMASGTLLAAHIPPKVMVLLREWSKLWKIFCQDPYLAILTYWSTQLQWCGLSPAQLLMVRQLHTNLPQSSKNSWNQHGHTYMHSENKTRSLSPIKGQFWQASQGPLTPYRFHSRQKFGSPLIGVNQLPVW